MRTTLLTDLLERLRRELAASASALQGLEQSTQALHDVAKIFDVALPGVVFEPLVEV